MKIPEKDDDSLRREYNIGELRGKMRGKYEKSYNEHLRVIRLSEEVALAFKPKMR